MMGKPIKYSQQEVSFVSKNRTMTRIDLHKAFCQQFNRTDISAEHLKCLRQRNGWLTGRTGCFEKGCTPHPNSGPKGPNKTSFKKGSKPANLKPIGTERINTENYIEVKTGPGKQNWSLKHRIVWQQHNGPLTSSDIIRFKDGNTTNCHINNLEKFNRVENIELNRMDYKNAPKSIKPTIALIAKIANKKIQLKQRANA